MSPTGKQNEYVALLKEGKLGEKESIHNLIATVNSANQAEFDCVYYLRYKKNQEHELP